VADLLPSGPLDDNPSNVFSPVAGVPCGPTFAPKACSMRRDAAPATRTAGEAGPPPDLAPPPVRPSAAAPPQDRAWVAAAYDAHARELWAMLYAECCDPDLARDALQESFLKLHGQAKAGLRDVKAWLVRVGRNWLRDAVRRRRHAAKPTDLLDGLPATGHGDPVARLEAEEAKDHVRAALARLRDDDRHALVLRYALDWPSARIAETLDSTPAAVDMRLSRARKRLAELLQEDGFPFPADGPRPRP